MMRNNNPELSLPNGLRRGLRFASRSGRRRPLTTAVAPLLVMLVLFSMAAGCRREEPHQAPAAAEPETESAPLARVGDAWITEADFDFEIRRRIETGRPVGDAASVLQDLVERQAMLNAAAASPLFDDPAVRRDLENQKLTRWLDAALQTEKDRVTISEEELRNVYEETIEEHTRPETVRLAILFRRLNPRDPGETRETLAGELLKARRAFLDNPAEATRNGRIPGFGIIAAESSEDTVSRYRGGDLGWLEVGRTEYRLPAAVLETGFALPVGGVSDVLETDEGLYLIMKSDRREASITPFETAAATLRRRLIRQRQEEVERTFMNNLLEQASIEINPDHAARISVPDTAPERRSPDLLPLTDPRAGQ